MATDTGRRAETRAVEFLEDQGFKILARNWRNRWCEIDVVARRGDVTHIIEVKYRSNPAYGSGFEYITTDKLHRLERAAEMLMNGHDQPFQIDVVAVTGDLAAPEVSLLENVTA